MSDLEYFYAVMAAFYLWECTHWLRTPLAPFVAWAGNSFRPSQPFFVANGRDGGLHFASPLPAGGTFHVTSEWPFVLSPAGVINSIGTMISFADEPQFAARRHRLMVGTLQFATLGSPAQTRRLAVMLNTLVATPQSGRAELIAAWMRDTMDSKAVSARLREFGRVARLPGILATVLLLYVFVVAPVTIRQLGFATAWPWLVGGLVILCAVNSIAFFRAHRWLHPDLDDERFAHFLMVLLFPPAGMRTRDMLSRPLLESFHPLAPASELCGSEHFKLMASRVARDLRYPRARPASAAMAADDVWQWFHQASLDAVGQFVARNHMSLDQLAAAPARADDGSRSHCPRCHVQFTQATGTCSDCGVALVRF